MDFKTHLIHKLKFWEFAKNLQQQPLVITVNQDFRMPEYGIKLVFFADCRLFRSKFTIKTHANLQCQKCRIVLDLLQIVAFDPDLRAKQLCSARDHTVNQIDRKPKFLLTF